MEYATLVRYMLLLLGAWHLALELLRRALLAFRIVQVDATGRLVTPGAESLTAELAGASKQPHFSRSAPTPSLPPLS